MYFVVLVWFCCCHLPILVHSVTYNDLVSPSVVSWVMGDFECLLLLPCVPIKFKTAFLYFRVLLTFIDLSRTYKFTTNQINSLHYHNTRKHSPLPKQSRILDIFRPKACYCCYYSDAIIKLTRLCIGFQLPN